MNFAPWKIVCWTINTFSLLLLCALDAIKTDEMNTNEMQMQSKSNLSEKSASEKYKSLPSPSRKTGQMTLQKPKVSVLFTVNQLLFLHHSQKFRTSNM